MEIVAVFSPLLGALLAGLFGRQLGDKGANAVTCTLMVLAAVCSVILFQDVALAHAPRTIELFTWIASGKLNVSWSLRFDQLAAVMVFVVNVVSCMVHIYSVGYMSHDKARARFTAYLSGFTFAMLMLVTSDNLVQLFFGWEGVGLMSYLLIGFWNEKESANNAAIKAFVMNRIGDFGLALGLMAIFFVFGSLNFDEIFSKAADSKDVAVIFLGHEFNAINLICALLFVGAMGKSAQLGLHTWLPDAMEGPTPVSALIHAATMVTAGVFMVARFSPLFEYAPTALAVVGVIGGTTAVFAASVGMAQNDIKRVIAYSTCSQLGYMFFAAGVSAYTAAMFHLFTHAFFKALLFLSAGSVIHAMSGEQDMRRMGGLWTKIPITYAVMWIGSLSLAGIPYFAGYFSKDSILMAAWASGTAVGRYSFTLGIFAAFLTAFYSWRLLILTFHGRPRADEHTMHHVHESPWIMLLPLFVLALGAILTGWQFEEFFIGDGRAEFWRHAVLVLPAHDSIARGEDMHGVIEFLPLIAGGLGIVTAYVCYSIEPDLPSRLSMQYRSLYQFLLNKWYFDELYDRLFVRNAFSLGEGLWRTGDGKIIDGLGPDGIAAATRELSREASRLQTGYLYHYAFAMLIGVVALVTWYLLPR